MLAPRLLRPVTLEPLSSMWRERGSVRVQRLFVEAEAGRFLEALRSAEHVASYQIHSTEGFQLWRYGWVPGSDCEHPLCELGRWLRGDGTRWVSSLTGLALAPAPDPTLVSVRAAKGSYAEPYDEAGDGRAVAYRIHLTPAIWPAEWGGHLECLEGRAGPVIDRFAPAWNALDLVDVREPGAWRRLPLIDKHLEGWTVSRWFHAAP